MVIIVGPKSCDNDIIPNVHSASPAQPAITHDVFDLGLGAGSARSRTPNASPRKTVTKNPNCVYRWSSSGSARHPRTATPPSRSPAPAPSPTCVFPFRTSSTTAMSPATARSVLAPTTRKPKTLAPRAPVAAALGVNGPLADIVALRRPRVVHADEGGRPADLTDQGHGGVGATAERGRAKSVPGCEPRQGSRETWKEKEKEMEKSTEKEATPQAIIEATPPKGIKRTRPPAKFSASTSTNSLAPPAAPTPRRSSQLGGGHGGAGPGSRGGRRRHASSKEDMPASACVAVRTDAEREREMEWDEEGRCRGRLHPLRSPRRPAPPGCPPLATPSRQCPAASASGQSSAQPSKLCYWFAPLSSTPASAAPGLSTKNVAAPPGKVYDARRTARSRRAPSCTRTAPASSSAARAGGVAGVKIRAARGAGVVLQVARAKSTSSGGQPRLSGGRQKDAGSSNTGDVE
ncbi:hypothetical protein B0H10DRAFT_2204481 [Mycena sp. CBHHK59/15]|nr:hypothetical protein B0H10DRAFT_2204481 [Mycena sp. CBHHK59/15]